MWLSTGVLGTRADLIVDIVVVGFVVLPFSMLFAFHLARRGRYHQHRRIQTASLVFAFLAILALELDIRFSSLMSAIRLSPLFGSDVLRYTLIVHIAIAVTTFFSWATLAVLSWRRFTSTLPGSFSSRHRKWGRATFAGLCLTSLTGLVVYIMGFVL